MPCIVKANHTPAFQNYIGIIYKETGADYYEFSNNVKNKKGHLSVNNEIKVVYEILDEGVYYLRFCEIENDKNCFYVNSTDVLPKNGPVSPDLEEFHKLSEPHEFIIISDEANVLQGPSIAYKTVGKLNKGYKGKYTFDTEMYDPMYIYIDEGGIKGWISTEYAKVKNTQSIVTGVDITTNCGVVPANTIFDESWNNGTSLMEAYIEYNGCISGIDHKEFATLGSNQYVLTLKPITLYETADFNEEMLFISKNKKLKILSFNEILRQDSRGNYYTAMYVEYSGNKGWYKWKSGDYEYMSDQSVIDSTEEDSIIDEPTVEETKPTQQIEKINSHENKKMDTATKITICCIAAIGISIIAIINIVILNKKR